MPAPGYVQIGELVECVLISGSARGEQVAILYSGAAQGKPLPMVLRITVGGADRGACIRELSQYQQEIEYLFVPCSFLGPDGPTQFLIGDDGLGVRVVPVRISTSHSARTVEDLLGEKKNMHVTAFKYLVEETRATLTLIAERGGEGEVLAATGEPAPDGAAAKRLVSDFTGSSSTAGPNPVEGLLERIVGQCKARLLAHEAVDARDYADNAVSQRLVGEMLDTRRWAVSKLRLWLEDPTMHITNVVNYPLRGAHRMLTKYLTQSVGKAVTAEERRAAALAVCKARGTVLSQIDGVNEAGEDPLVAAASDGAAAADIRMLIAAGAAVNGVGAAPLRESARYGHVDVVAALLGAQASVDGVGQVMPTQSSQVKRALGA
jgi:hypothetical protein